ncbi:hypothetical protein ES703_94013 [subsurface metagenome]
MTIDFPMTKNLNKRVYITFIKSINSKKGMQEFRVNEYLSLRLEGENTVIYVGGERFRQCKFLLLNIQINEIQTLDEIESIDEASEKLDKTQEYHKKKNRNSSRYGILGALFKSSSLV